MLLLDVDGVISLFGFDHRRPPAGGYALVDGAMHFLSATAATLIAELARWFELVWCSGWEEKADEHLPTQLGLPRGLAHLSFAVGGGPGRAGPTLLVVTEPAIGITAAHVHALGDWAASLTG
jgi:hypothetical protein